LIMLNPNTKKRLLKFKSNKRAYYSFLVLIVSYFISLFAPIISNNKPLILIYEGRLHFPVLFFYTERDFGGEHGTRINYKRLAQREDFQSGESFMLFPPIPYGVNEDNLESLEFGVNPPSPPSRDHLLGTDDRGRDVFTRIFYGYRIAMTFSLLLVVVEMFLAIIIGGIQGYFGGILDISMQRFIEILSSIPFLYIILIMGSFLGTGFMVLLVTYGALSWIGLSYYMRGEFLRLRNLQFVDAARALGVSTTKILFRHLLPNAITPLVTFLPFTLISAISILSALDFLGYGIPAPNPSWGEMIGQGRERLTAYWLIAFPSLALFVTILLTAFVGEGMRDAFDSKEKVEYD
jgi:microcin C transport system permease protein